MILRASGLVVFSSSAAEGRDFGVVLLPFFWSKALKSSFLPMSRLALLPDPEAVVEAAAAAVAAAVADSLMGESAVLFPGE